MEHENHITENGTYIKVWAVLLVLMAVNIFIAGLKTVPYTPAIVLLISCIQAFIAMYWFMHLKFDNALLRVLVSIAFLLFGVVIVILMLDYWFR